MFAVTDVHLIGGDPWWHQLIGPALIAATAIAAAWIAARTANHRQHEQLKHDRELQAQQLSYDREQRNRQHIRSAVDDAMRSVDAVMRTGAEYEALILVEADDRATLWKTADDEGTDPAERAKAIASFREKATELFSANQAAHDAAIDLVSENLRLSLRLGNNHSIVKAHMAIHDAFTVRIDMLQSMHKREVTEQDRDEVRSQSDANAAIVSSFLSECRKWFAEG